MTNRKMHMTVGFLLLSLLTFIGLIVRLKLRLLEPIFYSVFPQNIQSDFFSYYKMLFLIIITVLACLILVYGLIKDRRSIDLFKQKHFYALLILAIIAILSSIFSKHSDISLMGSIDRYEGLYVWLCYLAIPFLITYFIRDRETVDRFINVLLIPSTIIIAIGALQFFGFDIFKSNWITAIVVPHELRNTFEQLTINTAGVYSTLYNQNYVGGFVVLVLPLYAYVLQQHIRLKKNFILPLIGLGLSLIAVIGSYSTSGYVALAVMLLVMLFFFVRTHLKMKNYKSMMIILLLLLTGFVLVISNTGFQNEFKYGGFFEENNATNNSILRIKDIQLLGSEVKIITNRSSISIKDKEQNLRFFGEDGDELVLLQYGNTNTFVVEDIKYRDYAFSLFLQDNIVEVKVDTKVIAVYLDEEGLKIAGVRDIPMQVVNAPYIGFDGSETFASSRGYIWSRTLPLLLNSPIIGYGADTLLFNFPHNDIGRLNSDFSNFTVLVDKPHNMYLLMAVNFGLVFLGLFLWMVMFLLYDLLRKINLYNDYLDIALLSSLIGFLVSGLANDSNISTSPYFWIVFSVIIVVARFKSNREYLT